MNHETALNKRLKMLRFWHRTRRLTEFIGSRFSQETLYQGIFESALSALKIDHPPFYAVKSGANYSLLYAVLRAVTETPCRSFLELGAGQTTILLEALKQVRPDLEVMSLETDRMWADTIGARVSHEVVYSDLSSRSVVGVEVSAYADLSALAGRRFDIVLVDGPPGGDKRHSRWASLEILARHLSDDFLVIFDDAERGGEQETIRQFAAGRSLENGLTLGTKGQIMLFTPSFMAAKFF